MSDQPVKTYPTLGCCGLDCGLCPRYYTVGSSRCPGCCGLDFFNKHPSCGYITCCVKKNELEVCALCDEFSCRRFAPSVAGGGEYDSFLTYKKVRFNLDFIRKHGLRKFMEEQGKRMRYLETMLRDFDDGRSKSFYCIAATLLSKGRLEGALERTIKKIKVDKVGPGDIKTRAKILRGFLEFFAAHEKVELRLRKKEGP